MHGRTLAIGDIHGCDVALETLLEAMTVEAGDTIVILGDVVDRGPGTFRCIELLLELADRVEIIFIRGNHEEMMLDALAGGQLERAWLQYGGLEALASYGDDYDDIPAAHVDFLRSSIDYYESETEIFVHANLEPGVPLDEQSVEWLRWTRFTGFETPHPSGNRVLCGHSVQGSGLPGLADGWICLDTGAYTGGYLTGLDVSNDIVYQTEQSGSGRMFQLDDL